MLIDLIKIAVLGLIEGVTEWLPISSTGHLILFNDLLQPKLSPGFMEMFNVVIQLGAVIAVIIIFFHNLWPFHTKANKRQWFVNPVNKGFLGGLQSFSNNYLYLDKIILWMKIFVSSIPALIVGLLFSDLVEEKLQKPIPIALMLIIYGIIFIIVEILNKNRNPRVRSVKKITFLQALLMGCFQALSVIPGTSRSGATIIGALILGLSRPVAVKYAFYMAIPAILGSSGIKLIKYGLNFTSLEAICLFVGLIVAFFVSMLVIRFLIRFVSNHDFKIFGYYRIILGVIIILVTVIGAGSLSVPGNNSIKGILVTFFVSMVPIVELRGAIPIGIGMGVPGSIAYIVAVVGNMIPVAFIYFFARKLLIWGSDKPVIGRFFKFCLVKGEKGGRKLEEKAGRGLFFALLAFVAIPLPGTGAWTGTLAASILDMGFKRSVIAVTLGVLVAGIIMAVLSTGIFSIIL